uniref:Protein phosphatase 1 regulatory subunit 35 C-terminal domain-containing protein n=2 Tax=Arion vulgaris TaxID=1028688 RepID=A0A0B6ZSW0_9EUPU
MTSSIGIKTAVSDYEHLNRKNHHRYVTEKQPNYSSEDEDFLPLKPKKPAQIVTNKNIAFHEMTNVNNNRVTESEIIGHNGIRSLDMFDDVGQSFSSVPVPVAWSPGMLVTSNPSLFITPQKPSISHEKFLTTKENVLVPHSANKIPKPVAWSPGMMAQLDPNLFITPEKHLAKKCIANVIGNEKENIIENENLSKHKVPTKNKEAHSVRFDLPSSTSGDETTDHLSESNSPITLRGCEMRTERQSFESPIWKTFSPQKSYNPCTYSDESSFDDSIVNSLPTAKKDSHYGLLKTFDAADSVSDNSIMQPNLTSSKLTTITSTVASIHSSVLKQHKQNEINQQLTTGRKRDTKSSNSKPHKIEHSKSNILLASKAQNEKRKIDEKSKEGAHFLISSPSQHEQPTPGSTVIREMKNNLLSTEYSFPFELRTPGEDAEYEHIFARPEYNSTLKVRAELDTLYEQEVDVMKAVEVNLAKSEVKRIELNEKAAACTNRLSGQFKNLVDLNTSVESLCDRIVRMRTSKVPSKKKVTQEEKKSTGPTKTPDLMEFFTSDLQKEYPDFTLSGATIVTSKPLTSPKDIVFDLYRHNRLWQGINDF